MLIKIDVKTRNDAIENLRKVPPHIDEQHQSRGFSCRSAKRTMRCNRIMSCLALLPRWNSGLASALNRFGSIVGFLAMLPRSRSVTTQNVLKPTTQEGRARMIVCNVVCIDFKIIVSRRAFGYLDARVKQQLNYVGAHRTIALFFAKLKQSDAHLFFFGCDPRFVLSGM